MSRNKEEAIKAALTVPGANEHENWLIRSGKLPYKHHNDKSIFFVSNSIHQTTDREANVAKHWYRSMSRSDYIRLKNGGQLHAGDSYGGIATNFNYVDTKYFTNNSDGTHVVEFWVDNTMLLNAEFQSVRGGGPIENAKA